MINEACQPIRGARTAINEAGAAGAGVYAAKWQYTAASD